MIDVALKSAFQSCFFAEPEMFMSDVCKKEEIRKIAIQDLRNFGIKHRPKKPKQTQTVGAKAASVRAELKGGVFQEARTGKKVFKRPLHSLPTEMVTLLSGQQLIVPQIVHRLCTFILRNAETEGLFRKGGSKSRQNEIKVQNEKAMFLLNNTALGCSCC